MGPPVRSDDVSGFVRFEASLGKDVKCGEEKVTISQHRPDEKSLSSSPRTRGPITTVACRERRSLSILPKRWAAAYGSRLALRLAGTTIGYVPVSYTHLRAHET